MKYTITTFLVCTLLSYNALSQHMIGISSSNYAGTHGVIANPSYVADTRHGFYFNLFSVNAYFTNNFYSWDGPSSPLKTIMNGEEIESSYLKESSSDKPSLINTGFDVRGPSFLLKLNSKSGLAVYTRLRGSLQANNLSKNLTGLILSDIDEDELVGKPKVDNTFTINANAFSEIGLTYGRTIWESDQHFLKTGITVKKIIGSYSAFLVNEAMDFQIQKKGSNEYYLEVERLKMNYGYSTDSNFEDELNPLDSKSTGKGWGFDIGFTYEHRPDVEQYRYVMDGKEQLDNRRNKYKYRVGLALLDIGNIKYNSPLSYNYAFERQNTFIYQDDLDEIADEPVDALNKIFDLDPNEGKQSFKTGLPTSFQMEIDYRLAKKVYANFTIIQSLRGKESVAIRQFSMVAVTPRLEMKWFELAVPVTLMNDYRSLAIGASAKLGSLFVGSNNLGGVLGLGEPSGVDIYAGLAVQLFKGKKKDKDKDGVSNRKDKCKKVPGTWELRGCPEAPVVGDSDKATAVEVPEEAVEAEQQTIGHPESEQ